MGEAHHLPGVTFNRSIRIEARPERMSSDGGSLLQREIGERLGVFAWLALHLEDGRDQDMVTHPFEELLRTMLLLLAQGWRDQDDADALRDDPAFRLSVSERRGQSSLREAEDAPDGLASQPTLSRLVTGLAGPANRQGLRRALVVLAGRRIRAQGGPPKEGMVLDFDSLPREVHAANRWPSTTATTTPRSTIRSWPPGSC